MISKDWGALAMLSIKQPGTAARTLMAMDIDTGALWNALILAAVANTFLYKLSNLFVMGPSPLPGYFDNPLIYFAVVASGLVLSVLAMTWVGHRLGGQGRTRDILVLLVWIQILRLLVQVAVLVLMFIAPVLSALLVLASALIGIYMLVHFIDQAHGFNSPGRAAVVMIASFMLIAFGISVFLLLLGGPDVGSTLEL